MRLPLPVLLAAVAALAPPLHAQSPLAQSSPAQQSNVQTCADLARQVAPHTAITLAASTPATPQLPTFCRVTVTLNPTPDSDIHIEVWLPLTAWNGKFLALGSGGWGGSFAFDGMADALRRGYATASTDDGHTGPGASFLLGHPEKFIDFAYRAEHEMTLEARRLILAFYGRPPRLAYWLGCSGGGREGLLQAARYPDEFDGIVAGDPANIRRNAWALWLAVNTFKDPAAVIPPGKYPLIHRFVLDACDALDGLRDGLIENPKACHVNLQPLACQSSDTTACLTPRQIQTAQTILSPATTPSGNVLFPPLEPGSELGWARLAGGPNPGDLFLDQFRFAVFHDPAWDWRTFDLERDAARAHAIDQNIDELDPNLAAFARHGGKLLLYHGWADQQVAPGSTIDFYRAAAALSPNPAHAADWLRLFMVPGMAHCSGGEGPDTFDRIATLERWVEHAEPPTRILATHHTEGIPDRTRPLCPYPQQARYLGHGSPDEAASFTCRFH